MKVLAIGVVTISIIMFSSFIVNCQSVESEIERFAYPIYLHFDSSNFAVGSCFFINVLDSTFLVTARHNFFDSRSRWNGVSQITVYLEPHLKINPGVPILVDSSTILPACFDFGCADIAILPLPRTQRPIKYVNLNTKAYPQDTVKGKEVFIVGYPKDSLTVTKTRLVSWNRGQTFVLTDSPSRPGSSGGPVFMVSAVDNGIQLVGVNSGKSLNEDSIGKGMVAKADLLRKLLARVFEN